MKLIQRINLSISVAVLLICVVTYLLFGWSATGWKALIIPTGSMRPAITPGSLVLVHRVPVSLLKIGDVITHTSSVNPNLTLSHRIIKIYRSRNNSLFFITKGDANEASDAPVPANEVIGKVTWRMPGVGRAMLSAKKPIVILPIIYIAGLLIIIEEIQRLAGYYRKFAIYRLPGFERQNASRLGTRVGQLGALGMVLVTICSAVQMAVSPVASAMHANTVSLSANRINAILSPRAPGQCSGENSSDLRVSNSTDQTAASGSVTVQNGSSAASGSVSNGNNTTIAIMTNC